MSVPDPAAPVPPTPAPEGLEEEWARSRLEHVRAVSDGVAAVLDEACGTAWQGASAQLFVEAAERLRCDVAALRRHVVAVEDALARFSTAVGAAERAATPTPLAGGM